MAQATTNPARALARLMCVAFAAIIMMLVLSVGAVGVADSADPTGATPTPPAAALP